MAYANLVSGSTTFGQLYSIINANFAAVMTFFAGTSFPSSPVSWQPCVRTDLKRFYYYDGTSTTWEDITDLFPDFQAVLAEVVAARGAAASLAARLDVALNPDGTLIAGAPAGGWWSTEAGAVARISGTQFSVAGDKTAIYKKDRAILLDQTVDAYGHVAIDSTYSSGTGLTTVTVTGATVDSGLTAVQYGQPVVSAPNMTPKTLYAADSVLVSIMSGMPISLPLPGIGFISNLKLVVNAAVNKLDVFSKTGGAVPDASNIIGVAIPDGTGLSFRTRAAAYLSGTSQFILADAANYWSKGSLDAEIKNAYLYAIWDGTGIVWALGGYSGFTMVPTTTTVTDDDYFLLEASSTYTRDAAHYCVAVARIRYQYDIADSPDHTIQATIENAPQIMWNPKSDYGYQKNLATSNSSATDIAEYSAVSVVVKQSGKYKIIAGVFCTCSATSILGVLTIKTGSSNYASASQRSVDQGYGPAAGRVTVPSFADVILNRGDTIHLGASVAGGGTRILYGNDINIGGTKLNFHRVD